MATEENANVNIRVSLPLINELRKFEPSYLTIPATYIVDMLLREKLEQLKKKAQQ
jgi:hypothetical protein